MKAVSIMSGVTSRPAVKKRKVVERIAAEKRPARAPAMLRPMAKTTSTVAAAASAEGRRAPHSWIPAARRPAATHQ